MISFVVSKIALCALCAGLSMLLALRLGGLDELLTCAIMAVILYFALPGHAMPDVNVPVKIVLIGNSLTLAFALLALIELGGRTVIGGAFVAHVLAMLSARYLKMVRYVET